MSTPTLSIYQREMEHMFTIVKNQKSAHVSAWVDKLWYVMQWNISQWKAMDNLYINDLDDLHTLYFVKEASLYFIYKKTKLEVWPDCWHCSLIVFVPLKH